jgi:hypothetical protein
MDEAWRECQEIDSLIRKFLGMARAEARSKRSAKANAVAKMAGQVNETLKTELEAQRLHMGEKSMFDPEKFGELYIGPSADPLKLESQQ